MPPNALTRAKPKLLALHRWVAVVAGVFLISQGLSGSVIAFRYELNRALHPGAMTVAPASRQAPLAAIITAAQSALPGAKVTRVDYPHAPDDAYIARMTAKGGALSIATVDQKGHVTRVGAIWSWPVEMAYAIHESLLSGETGERAIGFVGLSALVLIFSGLAFWWPVSGRFGKTLQQTLQPQWAKGRITRVLHRAIAVLYGLYLIMMATIGVTMAWSPWTEPLVGTVLPFSVERPKVPKKACAQPVPVDDAVTAAQKVRPGQAIKSVRFQAKGRIVAVYFQSPHAASPRASDHVWLNACNAKILSVDDKAHSGPGDRFFDWLLPVHSGEWLGWPGRVLSWSAALALAVMGLSGYLLWLWRITRHKSRAGVSPQ